MSVRVECTTQEEVDRAAQAGYCPIVRSGRFEVHGSASLRAYGSATVSAYGSATVSASGSATVSAYDSATVSAYGSATVCASGSATVSASQYVPVQIRGVDVRATGGVHIVIPPVATLADWADCHGLDTTTPGTIVVYKAVRDDLCSDHHASYEIGGTTVAADYDGKDRCGGGLHFARSPHHALAYDSAATRYLACRVLLADAVLVDGDKVKARSCDVLHEVDVFGAVLAVSA